MMNTLETLIKAIKERKPIKFEYNKIGKISGLRFGNPHAVFIFTTKTTRIQSTKVHIVQTGGVSDSNVKNVQTGGVSDSNVKNEFRTFDIKEISNIEIEDGTFTPDTQYNPNWQGYANIIAKI